MNNPDSRPMLVTGEERVHPAIRVLARACIALAQERLAERKDQAEAADTNATNAPEGTATPSTVDEPVVTKATKKPGTAKHKNTNDQEGSHE